jgi:hypothetical protein
VYTAFKHDFAVVKIWDSTFTWVGTTTDNYAALYAGSIALNGNEWAYGIGAKTPNSIDYRVRRDSYTIKYADTFVIGAFGVNAQICSGDSGGPLGVFVSNPERFAVVGVANIIEENELGSVGHCGLANGGTYWSNVVNRIWYVEMATGKTCSSVNHNGVVVKECWH